MALSETDIYNMALSAAGQRARVSITSENTREAQLCRTWYSFIRDTSLRGAHWGCARKPMTLSVQAERDFSLDWQSTDPEPNIRFAYALPSDFLYPRFLYGYQSFIMTTWGVHRSLQTDAEDAILIYTWKNTDPSSWDQGLQDAVIHGLAAAICMPLSAKPQRAERMLEIANAKILDARVQNANESDSQVDSMPDWLAVRGISVGSIPSRYIYPTGPLLSLGMFTGTST